MRYIIVFVVDGVKHRCWYKQEECNHAHDIARSVHGVMSVTVYGGNKFIWDYTNNDYPNMKRIIK